MQKKIMKIKSIDLAWINAYNFKQSKDFFVNVLGMNITQEESEHYAWVELQGTEKGCRLGIGEYNEQYDAGIKPGQNAILTFSVDNIETAKQYLLDKKVILVGDIIEIPGHIKMLMIKDPEGNHFQLVQELNG